MENNRRISEIFDEIADMLSVADTATARFEVRAYRKAAETIGSLQQPVEEIYGSGGVDALMRLPGIGKGLASKIAEFLNTGKVAKYDRLKRAYPIEFARLRAVRGLGAKRIVELYKRLGVRDLESLARAVEEHKIAGLKGFGRRSEELMAEGLAMLASSKGRMPLGEALPAAEALVNAIIESGCSGDVFVAGSVRRMCETVGDIDILVAAEDGAAVIERFVALEGVKRVIAKGETKASVLLDIGINCDMRVVNRGSLGAALQYFTGSKDHGVQVRQIAVRKGLLLNEYGLYRRGGARVAGGDEAGIYERLGLQYVPPEMREARGEVELAKRKRIPRLVELSDLKGDMHTHTRETDGANSIEEMADAAAARGLSYIATTNHTKSLGVAHGMDSRGFARFFSAVDALNERLGGRFTVLKGVEVDILKDGSLDLERRVLAGMDCVVAAVHSAFSMSAESMTRRIVNAIDSGVVHILAHPTGRLIGSRAAYAVELDRIYDAAERNGVALEINSNPERLDLNDLNVLAARERKLVFAIDSDAHNASHFGFLRYGVGTARRGWLEGARVLNTKGIEALRRWLAR